MEMKAPWGFLTAGCVGVIFLVLLSFGPRAEATSTCACSEVECDNGIAGSCSAECELPRQATCKCDARCSPAGDLLGSNTCTCGQGEEEERGR